MLHGVGCSFNVIGPMEFLQNGTDVIPYGPLAQVEARCNFWIGLSLCDEVEQNWQANSNCAPAPAVKIGGFAKR